MSVYIRSGKVHGQVNDGAKKFTISCSQSRRPDDVVPELVTVEGFDEHL
jgi:hypothetical protein